MKSYNSSRPQSPHWPPRYSAKCQYISPAYILKQDDCETSILHLMTLWPCRIEDITVRCMEGDEHFFFKMKYMYLLRYASFYTETKFREAFLSTRSYRIDVLHASLRQVLTMTLVWHFNWPSLDLEWSESAVSQPLNYQSEYFQIVHRHMYISPSVSVTPKLMVFVKRNIKPSYGEQAAIMLSMQVDLTGHWSHLSDLPS